MSLTITASQKDNVERFVQCNLCFGDMEFTHMDPKNYKFNNKGEAVCHLDCWIRNAAACSWCGNPIDSSAYKILTVSKPDMNKMGEIVKYFYYYHIECNQHRKNFHEEISNEPKNYNPSRKNNTPNIIHEEPEDDFWF
jgi:hypothetical protein